MADENISIKIGLETSQFNNSLKGMMNELKALQKVDLTLLKPQDSKAVIARMGDLKDSIMDVQEEIKRADPGGFFQSFSTLAGPAVAAISGIAVGMEMFGAETENVEKIQRKLMAVISLISTAQTIADVDKLKSLLKQIPLQAAELKNKAASLLMIKEEIVQKGVDNSLDKVKETSIIKLTALQKLWNKAVASNSIGILITIVAGLVAGIVLLTKAFKDNNEVTKKSEEALDGTIIKNEELRQTHNEALITLRDLNLEFQKTTGSISEQEYELTKLNNKYIDIVNTINNKYIKSEEEAIKKSIGVWNTLKNLILTMGNPYEANIKNMEDAAEQLIVIQKEKDQELLDASKIAEEEKRIFLENENKKLEALTKELNDKLITDENIKAEKIRDERLRQLDESEADQRIKTEAFIAIWEDYWNTIISIEKKGQDQLAALQKNVTDQIDLWYKQLKESNFTSLDREIVSITEKFETLKVALDDAFPDKSLQEYIDLMTLLEKTFNVYTASVTKDYNKAFSKELFDYRVQYNLTSLDEMREQELLYLTDIKAYNKLGEEEQAKVRQSINEKYQNNVLENEKSRLLMLSQFGIDTKKQEYDIQLKELDLLHQRQLLSESEYQEAKQNLLDEYDEIENNRELRKQERINLFNEASAASIQMISDQQSAANEAELNKINNLYDVKKQKLDEQLEYGLIAQNEYDSAISDAEDKRALEEKKLRIKQVKQEKSMALLSIAIDTAVSILKAYAQLGPAGGLIATPFIIATGALSAATVAAKPIPQFADGGTMRETGTALVGEKGPELVKLPAGSQITSNSDLLSSLNRSTMTQEQVVNLIDIALQKYSYIPVMVSEYEITQAQTKVKKVKVNSEIQ